MLVSVIFYYIGFVEDRLCWYRDIRVMFFLLTLWVLIEQREETR